VHHRPRPVGGEGAGEVVLVAQVAAFERSPFHRPCVAALEIVERRRKVAGAGERLAGVAAHETGATGDENCLHAAGPATTAMLRPRGAGRDAQADGAVFEGFEGLSGRPDHVEIVPIDDLVGG
jgi:hypothetical protein